jgi:hypothetical protein
MYRAAADVFAGDEEAMAACACARAHALRGRMSASPGPD